MAGRFALVFFITSKFAPADLGLFGLFNTSIILGIQLVGLDFYVFSSREIVKPGSNRQFISFNQLSFHLICYGISIPLTCSLFAFGMLPWNYFPLFIVIFILEHLTNEIYRLLIVLKLSVQSSIVLFIKSALWVFLIPVVWHFDDSFQLMFYCWMIGLLGCLFYGYAELRKINGPIQGVFDKEWILTGIKISLPFFTSTLLLKITEHSNRYFIDLFQGKDDVGIFTFYSGFANILSTIVYTLIIMIQYPLLLEAFQHDNRKEQAFLENKILKDSIRLSIILAPILIGCVYVLTKYYQGGTYAESFVTFVFLVFTNIFINVNYATHFMLYAQKKDRQMLRSYCAGCLAALVLNLLLIPSMSVTGAAIANLTGFSIIALLQLYYARQRNQHP